MKPTKTKTRPKTRTKATKRPAAKRAAARAPAAKAAWTKPRKDLGAPINGFFAKQPQPLRAIAEELRAIIEATIPGAASSIKWGMPFFELGGKMVCAIGAHKSHVRLILAGPPKAFADPKRRLEGEAKGARTLKVRSLDELPRKDVQVWIRTAARLARGA